MNTIVKAFARDAVVHTSIRTNLGFLAVRDALPSDVEAYVNYWHYSGDEVKNVLGIDPIRLGMPDDSRARFLRMLRDPDAAPRDVIFSITLNDELIGYTNMNWYGPDRSYVHLHTYRAAVRSALRAARMAATARASASLASVLIGLIGMYFDLFPLRRILFQTRTTNRWINRALDLYMPPAETRFVTDPPGLALPGDCHIRYVHREDALWMQARAEFLARSRSKTTALATAKEPSRERERPLQAT